MVLPLIGAGAMALGTGASMYGQYQRDRAQRGVLSGYAAELQKQFDREQAALNQESSVNAGFAQERQGALGNFLRSQQVAQRPGTDEGFRSRQTGVLKGIGAQTGGAQSEYAYQGAPREGAEGQQAALGSDRNAKMAEALLADHTLRQIDAREQSNKNRLALGDLLRSGKAKTTAERFKLAKALRDLDWQRKTQAMQQQLDEAGRKGQWLTMLGTLGTQAGGMAMQAGLDPGDTAAEAAVDGGGGTDLDQEAV
jgi:hypothetical protein